MKPSILVSTVLLVLTVFAGCITDELPRDTTPEAIVKKVTVTLDESTQEAERLEDVMSVVLEYTHRGADVDPSELTISFLDESGDEREEPLSDYTDASTLRSGDRILVAGANLTSGAIVRQGALTVAAREGLGVDWFTATGYPIPIRTTEDGTATYQVSADSSLEFEARDFDFRGFSDDEGEGGLVFSNVDASFSAEAGGILEATSEGAAAGARRLTLDLDLDAGVDAEADATWTEEGERINEGGRFNVDAEMEAQVVLKFGADHALHTVGHSSRFWADGDTVVWNEEHPKSENWHPEDIEHPIADEREEYAEEEVEFDPEDVEASAVDFLDRLWNTRIGVGDEYRLEASSDGFGTGEGGDSYKFNFELVVQVVSRESRSVAAGTFDTYRVSQSIKFTTQTPATGRSDFDLSQFTIWVDAATYLPVFEQGKFVKSFDTDDVQAILESLEDLSPSTAPDDVTLALSATSTLQLQEYSGNLRTAPVVGLGGFSFLGQALVAAPLWLAADMGGDDYEFPEPSVYFSTVESEDRLVVESASDDADWNDVEVRVAYCEQSSQAPVTVHMGSAPAPYLNERATATGAPLNLQDGGPDCGEGIWTSVSANSNLMGTAEYLEFCATGDEAVYAAIELRNVASGESIGAYSFLSLAGC